MQLGLKDRTALVLGGGGGLGGAIAESLSREGARVAVADRDRTAAERTVGAIQSHGGRGLAVEWDLADLGAAADHVAWVERELGPVDVLVNITGGPPPTPAAGQEGALWSSHFESMVLSVIGITDLVLPGMRERGWGRIITSTSSGVVAPIPNLGLSNALRMSLVGWSKTLAGEVGKDGVTVNVVVPGRIATQRVAFLDRQKAERQGRTVEEVAAESTSAISLGRYGEPAEYGDVVSFLASERASYITGSVVRVDGGLIKSI